MRKLQYLGKENHRYSDEYFFMNLQDESFIHFTSLKRAKEIIKNGKILLNPPIKNRLPGAYAVFAISLTYGSFLPGVMSSVDKYSKMDGSEPVAIVFKTDTMPKVGFPEEVSFGEKDVNVLNSSIVSKEQGISMLKNTPEKIRDGQLVLYDPAIVQSIKFVKLNEEGNNPMKRCSSLIDKMANKLEKQGLFKEAHELDVISNTLDKIGGVGLSLMGSGEQLNIFGETRITNQQRRGYQKAIGNQSYYPSVGDITNKVVAALDSVGLVGIAPGQERWVGTLSGALSAGETANLKIELVKDNQKVINSILILNIFKMDNTQKISYELNTYLS
jgi:hypothetical protein